MRLIDAEWLKELYQPYESYNGKELAVPIGAILANIDDAPTIDAVSVVLGEWIVNTFDYKSVCSVCGANETDFIYGTEMWYGLGESKFCPNCGAKMDGERKGE